MLAATLAADRFHAHIDPPRGHVVHADRYIASLHGRIHGWRGLGTTVDTALRSLLEAYGVQGPEAFRWLDGVFAAVVWDRRERLVVAARDHIGIEPLYYRFSTDRIEIANRLDLFEGPKVVDEEFAATFIVERGNCTNRTVWSGIHPVPAGSTVSWTNGRLQAHRFWRPESLTTREELSLDEGAQTFGALLERAVANRIDPDRRTWAHLSGGLDSSSVVSVAGGLLSRGHPVLGGTVTLTDSLGNADESVFVDAVVRQQRFANVRIRDEWPWRDDGEPAPITDDPARDYPFYARDRRIGRLIRGRGGTSLLSGVGPDHLLPTSPAYIADLVCRRRWREAVTEICRWATATRRPVIRSIGQVATLLSKPSRRRQGDTAACREMLTWFQPAFARRHDMRWRVTHQSVPAIGWGRLFQSEVLNQVQRLAGWLPRWFSATGLELRHPFLDVPLVEFCLTLPYRCTADVAWSKPVLRRAMKGLVADEVRCRTTKGLIDPRICWTFAAEHGRLSRLLRNPVLADLGCIEPRRVQASLDAWSCGVGGNPSYLYTTLSLETWLSTTTGRGGVSEDRRALSA